MLQTLWAGTDNPASWRVSALQADSWQPNKQPDVHLPAELLASTPACWNAVLHPSKIHQALNGVLSIAAVMAIAIMPIGIDLFVVLSTPVLMFAIRRAKHIAITGRLSHFDPDENEPRQPSDRSFDTHRWQVQFAPGKSISGSLVKAGYRSSALLILVFQSEDNCWHHVPIWVDSVTPAQFSYLHCQLAFNTLAPRPRSIGALLRGVI